MISDDLTRRFIGVIDLQSGLAVHAVAGNRREYRATRTFTAQGDREIKIDGDFLKLIRCYQSTGIQSLYVADLNALQHASCQFEAIEKIAQAANSKGGLFLDLGICQHRWATDRGWIEEMLSRNPSITLVVATESAESPAMLGQVISRVGHRQVAVSFDYRSGQWCNPSTSDQQWFVACQREQIETVIGLDLATVGGKSVEATEKLCRQIRSRLPEAYTITGGGIRSESDAQRLVDAGADGLLVASLYTG